MMDVEKQAMERVSEEPVGATADTGHHLLLELGQGGTAQVFLAVLSGAQGIDKLVVLKFLKPLLAESPELRQMFVSEARFAARLNHANIVQTSGIMQMPTGPAIVMEYLEGQSVTAILARARNAIPLSMHLRIIVDALRGLHYAHELTDLNGEPLNVVHRDVSPQNVFVTYDGQVKLIDFGIAKVVGSGVETATGVIKGKVRYMPPEQIEGRAIDRRADIYAAGVMLWEAATRERMWKGQSDVAMMRQVLSGKVPKPRDTNPEIPEELERITLKALAFDRAERYATAAELEADLEAFLGTLPPVTGRDVSKFVTGLFGEVRAETKRIIDLQLKQRAGSAAPRPSTVDSDSISAVPVAAPLLKQALAKAGYTAAGYTATATAESLSGERLSSVTNTQPKSRYGRPVAIAIAALAVGIVGTRAFTQSRAGQRATQAAAAATLTVAATPPPAPTQEATAATPPPAPAPSPSASAAPSASATARASTPVAHRAPPPPPPPPPPAAKPQPPPQKKNCDPPYLIDANGIKHFKMECL